MLMLNLETLEEIIVKVIDLKVYTDFFELYQNYDKKEIGYLENELANPNDMLLYYKEEQIKKQELKRQCATLEKLKQS